jgi:hypothetical protein
LRATGLEQATNAEPSRLQVVEPAFVVNEKAAAVELVEAAGVRVK